VGFNVKKQDMKNAENNIIFFFLGVFEFYFVEVGVDESMI
jgi:hypothetical protein